MRLYALAALALGDRRYLDAAKTIYDYTGDFLLSPEGAYYVSQDADLVKGRHSEDYFALSDSERRSPCHRAQHVPAINHSTSPL